MENGGLEYKIGLDTSQLMRDINTAKKGFDSLTNEAISQGNEIEAAFDNVGQRVKNVIGSIAGITVGVTGFKQIVSSIASTRSYFQDIESSMKVFLGSAEKASEFTAELKDYAWYNMFEFSDLAGASKQLIAYGNSVETVIPTLDKLSNIAAGTGGDLQHFVDMFNRAKSTGQVMAKDMYSWAASGVVLKDVLKDMGETVSGTSITFDQLNRALDHVTGEGGMFHNLMGEQMENLSSWWGALQDDMSTMLNDLGTKLQDPMTDAMKVAHNLLDNYEDVLQVLKEVAIAFGTVKTASVLEGVYGKLKDESLAQEVENLKELAKAYEDVLPKESMNEVAKLGLKEGTQEYIDALKIQHDQLLKNADLELKSADAALDKAGELVKARQSEVDIAKEIEQSAFSQLQSAKGTGDAIAIETAERNLEVATMQRQSAEGKLVSAQEQKETAARNKNTATIQKEIVAKQADDLSNKTSAASTNILTAAKMRLIGVFNKLKAAMLANPFTAVAAAVTALAYGIYKLVTYETAAEKAQRELNEALEEMNTQQRSENANIDILFDRLRKAKEGTQEYANAKAAIQKEYGKYLQNQSTEIQNLQDIEAAYKAIKLAAMEAYKEQALAATQKTAGDIKTAAGKTLDKESYERFFKYQKELIQNTKGEVWKASEETKKEAEKQASIMIEQLNTFIATGEAMTGELLEYNKKAIEREINGLQQAIAQAPGMRDVFEKQIEELRKVDPTKILVGTLKRDVEYYSRTVDEAERMLENARIRYATIAKDSGTGSGKETQFTNLLTAFNAARDAYNDALAEVEKMKKDRDAFDIDQWEKATKELARAKGAYESLGGDTSQKQSKEVKDTFEKDLADMKSMYDQAARLMESTNAQTAQAGQELYDKLKGEGTDYLDYLLKLREKLGQQLTESQMLAINTAIADLTKPKNQDYQTDYLQGLIDTYKTYDEERKAIDDKYREAKTALEFLGEKEKAEMVQKEWDKAVKDVDEKFGKTIFKESAALAKAMENAGNQTKKSLKESLKTLKAVRDYKQGDKDALQGTGVTEDQAKKMSLEDLQQVYDQLIAVQDEYDKKSKYPFRNLIEGFKALKAAETAEKENNDSEAIYQKARAQQMFANAVDEGVVVVGKLAEGMKALGDATGNVEWQKFAEGLSDAVDIAQSAVSGAKTGGVWGALASVVMNIGSKVINSSAETAAQEKQREADQLDFQTRYNKLLSERNYLEQEYAGIMGADRMGRAAAAWQEAQDSLAKYNAAVGKSIGELELQSRNYTTSFMNPLEGIETKATEVLGKVFGQENVEKVEQFANKAANVLTLGISKGLLGIGAEKSNYNDSIKSAMERGLNELQAMQVQTKERKWYKIGSKDKYESLYDIAPQLWGGDINGEFDVEAAKELLQTNKDLSDVQKQQLENVIGLKEQYDEAMKVVKEMAQEIVGNIGNDMTDAIVTAVETGADAWDAFEASGANAIKNLGKQMVQSLIYDNWLKKYEDQIQEAIGSGDKQGVIDIIGQIGQEMPQMYEQGQALLKEVYDAGERMNYQMYQIDEQNREAQQKGIAQASQDSIDELNGRMTAVQGHTFAISQNTATLTQHTAQILRVLNGISTDTARLENIEANIVAMRSDMSNINNRGVIVRQ